MRCGAGSTRRALVGGRIEHALRFSLGTAIYAGTSEIQRNIIAQQACRLPAEHLIKGDVVLRVVQWATGATGRHALAAMVDHPDLEVVGVLVYSDDKAGRDAGELCGIAPIGVTATKDRDEILAPRRRLRRLHAAGRDEPDGCARRHLRAARVGQERGVDRGDGAHLPGQPRRPRWSTGSSRRAPRAARRSTPPASSRGGHRRCCPSPCRACSVPSTRCVVQELLDYSTYPSRDMLVDIMGFGLPADADVLGADPTHARRHVPGAADARRRRPRGHDRGLHLRPAGGGGRAGLRRRRRSHRARVRWRRCGSRPPRSSRGGPRSRSSTSPGWRPTSLRTGRAVGAGRSPSKASRRWCWRRRSPSTVRTRTTRAASARRCTRSTPWCRCARRRPASPRSSTCPRSWAATCSAGRPARVG